MPDTFRTWCRYVVETEQYDRTFAGTWSQHQRDCWIPDPADVAWRRRWYGKATPTQFAAETMRRLGLSPNDPTRRETVALSYSDCVEVLAREGE
jgi:hypothetical protein